MGGTDGTLSETGNWQLTLVNCGNENKSASGRRGGFRLGPGKTRLLDWLPFSRLRNWRIGAVGGLSDGAFFFDGDLRDARLRCVTGATVR